MFLSNTAHIIALSIDSCIVHTGGLKSLLSLSTKKSSKVQNVLFIFCEYLLIFGIMAALHLYHHAGGRLP